MTQTNNFEYRIFGLRRGGNHALIAWIMSAMPKNSVYYFNDVVYDFKNLFESIMTGAEDEKAGTVAEKIKRNPTVMEDKHCIIQSYEDQELDIIHEIDQQSIGKSKVCLNVVILRDPLNFVASRLQLYNNGNPYVEVTQEVMDLWEKYANEYLGNTSVMISGKYPTVFVNYNLWHMNEKYRNEIAEYLQIGRTADITAKMYYGGGSSFKDDGVNTKNDNSNKYNQRWRQFAKDPRFAKFALQKKLLPLCSEIFGPIL